MFLFLPIDIQNTMPFDDYKPCICIDCGQIRYRSIVGQSCLNCKSTMIINVSQFNATKLTGMSYRLVCDKLIDNEVIKVDYSNLDSNGCQ
jgi:hypothetical protein